MRTIRGMALAERRYSEMTMEPLRVTCELAPGSSVAGFELPTVDGLLAGALVRELTDGRGVEDTIEPYQIELPLVCLWRDGRGLPLWAATPLSPVGLHARDVHYLHRRRQPGTLTRGRKGRFVITPQMGRYADRQIPVDAVVCERLEGYCTGNLGAVASLLERISTLGKRRNAGMNLVQRWRVERCNCWGMVRDGMLARSVPAQAAEPLGVGGTGEPVPVGWTPPAWKPALMLVGWPAGSECRY